MICVRNCAIHKISLLFCFMKSQKFSTLYKYLILIFHTHTRNCINALFLAMQINSKIKKCIRWNLPQHLRMNETRERDEKHLSALMSLNFCFSEKKVKCFIVSAIFSLLYTPQRPYYKRNYIRTVPYNAI